jgi:hypothetical protein
VSQTSRGSRADYIDGDPTIPGPINGGILALDSAGLHFSRAGEDQLHAGIDDLRGITVSGSGGPRHRVRHRAHGTTRLAISRGERPMVWEFAIDRSRGVLLRERINRALDGLGRPPLPFVEALYDFEPSAEPVFAEAPPVPLRTGRREVDQGAWFRQRRYIFALVAAMVFLEIGLPLLILFVL